MLSAGAIGEQMIRDGVAWYDKSVGTNLNAQEHEMYAACEQAARNEHRGIWQDGLPVTPWDFRKAEADARARLYAPPVAEPRARPRSVAPSQPALSNDDLMGGMIGVGSLAGKPEIKAIGPKGNDRGWVKYSPEDRHFSILALGNSVAVTYPVLDTQGKTTDVHYVIGTKDGIMYGLSWAKAPNDSETDVSAPSTAIDSFVAHFNQSVQRFNPNFHLVAKVGPQLHLSGYTGRQYSLDGGWISGTVRVYTKQIGNEREVFMLLVLNGGEPPDSQFFSSFRIGRTQ